MGEEFHRGVCSSNISWWNTIRNTTTFDMTPSFSCSKEMIRDISHDHSINWNQPFLPIEFDHEDSSISPLKEVFLPGFFEPDPIKNSNNHLIPHQFFKVPSLPKQQQQQLNFPFWETSANLTPVHFAVEPRLEDGAKDRNLTTKLSVTKESGSGSEPAMKKPRLATPSLLPTFKVRKEKLGDRITALQQLVSPFGKTDTASVLHEAIEYIKFLHDQVDVLTTPNFKDALQMQHHTGLERRKNGNIHEELNQNLRSQGLCLVPISSTFAVASEFPMDFWNPNFGGSYM